MKTYSETKGKKPFDWNKALENPPEIGSEEHEYLVDLSGDWVTCACGNQCDIIPRHEDEPMDEILSILGTKFYCRISTGYWEDAKDILSQIEKRSQIVIEETILLNKDK